MSDYETYLEDQKNDTLGAGIDEKYLDFLTKELLPDFPYFLAHILDVGAGKFVSWDYFKEKFENEITGFDLGKASIEFCKEHNKAGMIEGDAHFLLEKIEPCSFDIVLSFHSLEHMYDLPKVLTNCFEALKPGGYFFFALPMPSHNWHKGHWYDVPSEEFMQDLCFKAGFKEILFSQTFEDFRFRPEREMVCLIEK